MLILNDFRNLHNIFQTSILNSSRANHEKSTCWRELDGLTDIYLKFWNSSAYKILKILRTKQPLELVILVSANSQTDTGLIPILLL